VLQVPTPPPFFVRLEADRLEAAGGAAGRSERGCGDRPGARHLFSEPPSRHLATKTGASKGGGFAQQLDRFRFTEIGITQAWRPSAPAGRRGRGFAGQLEIIDGSPNSRLSAVAMEVGAAGLPGFNPGAWHPAANHRAAAGRGSDGNQAQRPVPSRRSDWPRGRWSEAPSFEAEGVGTDPATCNSDPPPHRQPETGVISNEARTARARKATEDRAHFSGRLRPAAVQAMGERQR